MRRRLVLIASFLAAACVPKSQTPIVTEHVQPPPPRVVAAPRAIDWRDWPYTPGTWTYRRDPRGSIALFGTVGRDADVTLRCDAVARALYLSRSGTVAAPATIRTTSLTRALAVRPTGGTPAYVAAQFAPDDPLLDAMGFSRGRFTIEQPGLPPLVVPAWAEVERVVQDCRG